MTPEFVENGFDGTGVPWDWWVTMCDFIDKFLERGL